MTEESTAYDAPDPRASYTDLLFADVATDAEKALQLFKTYRTYDDLWMRVRDCYPRHPDKAEFVTDLIFDAATTTIANAILQAKGCDLVRQAWLKPDVAWWVSERLALWKCANIADVLRQYEEGGEPDYVRD